MDKVWKINWAELWKELKNWELPWRELEFGDFGKTFIGALIPVLSSNWDVYSDGQLGRGSIAILN